MVSQSLQTRAQPDLWSCVRAVALEQPWHGHGEAQGDSVNSSPRAENSKLAPALYLSCTFSSWSVFRRKIGSVCPKVLGWTSPQDQVFTRDWSCRAALTLFWALEEKGVPRKLEHEFWAWKNEFLNLSLPYWSYSHKIIIAFWSQSHFSPMLGKLLPPALCTGTNWLFSK